MARRNDSNQPRATDRLNLALARISTVADLAENMESSTDKSAIVTSLRKQLGEALDEAHAALGDIRNALSAI